MTGQGGEPTLEDIAREFPDWECYMSFGWCWATPRDDPDVRMRGEDATDLRDMINRWAGLHEDGDTGT
jgi:hypothetical protein